MIGVSGAAQEVGAWVAIILPLLAVMTGLWRLAVKANRIIETTEQSAKLIRYHLGPNGSTPPIHRRLAELERVHDIEPPEIEGYR